MGSGARGLLTLPSEPVQVLLDVATELDRLGIEYLLGGSLASSLLGEPRSTVDVDLAVRLAEGQLRQLVAALDRAFFVDPEAAREALRRGSAFNVIHRATALKVDLFPLAGDPFDLEQMRRRIFVAPSAESPAVVAVSSAEDLVLRKLAWYRAGGGVSDRQWRDVLGILKVQGARIDLGYLRRWADALGLRDLVERACSEATSDQSIR